MTEGNSELLNEMISKPISWVTCPICEREWTKLRACLVWLDGKPFENNICVECAERPRNLESVAAKWPLNLGHESLVFNVLLHPAFFNLAQKDRLSSCYHVIVNCGDGLNFDVCSRGSNINVTGTGIDKSEPQKFDNTIAAWFWIRDRITNGETTKKKKGW